MNRKYSSEDDESDDAPEVEPEIGNRFVNEVELERQEAEMARSTKKKRAMCMVRRAVRSRS